MPDKAYATEMARIHTALYEELTDTFGKLGTCFFQKGLSLEEIMGLPVPSAMYQVVQSTLPLLLCQLLLERAYQENQITARQLGDLKAYLNNLHDRAEKTQE